MDISWTRHAGSENAAICSDRDTLISLVNDVKHMIESRDSSALPVSFELLVAWLGAHFAEEEKKAQAANIDFSDRKLEQQFELNELLFLRDELVAKNGEWPDNEAKLDIQFLSNWLIEHITNEDMQNRQTRTGDNVHDVWAGKEALAQGV